MIYHILRLYILIYLYEFCSESRLVLLVDKKSDKTYWMKLMNCVLPRVIDLHDTNSFRAWYAQNSLRDTLDIVINTTSTIILDTYASKMILAGGDVLDCDIIMNCLLGHKGKINVYVPWIATSRYHFGRVSVQNDGTSAGTLIALCGHNIYMNSYASLGPTDPIFEVDDDATHYSHTELQELINIKGEEDVSDKYLLSNIRGAKTYNDTLQVMRTIFHKRHRYIKKKRDVTAIINEFASGKYDHSRLFNLTHLKSIGLHITIGIPNGINSIFTNVVKLDVLN